MSHSKCCYSEFKIDQEGRDFTIDHFFPKSKYPDKVVLWENLLPSSQQCNRAKSDWDTMKTPIIDPTQDEPREHLILKNYRFYPKEGSKLGEATIKAVDLNNRKHLTSKRFQVGDELIRQLEELLSQIQEYHSHSSKLNSQRANRFIRTLENLMFQGTETEEHSATVATTLLNDSSFQVTKTLFQEMNIWTNELQELEKKNKRLAFDIL